MNQIVLFGLSALTSVTGQTGGSSSYPTLPIHLQEISEFSQEYFEDNLRDGIENIYDLTGETRYLEVTFKDGGYLIYDKLFSDIIEFSTVSESPFDEVDDTVKIYGGAFNYLTYNQEGFVDLNNYNLLDTEEVYEKYFVQNEQDENILMGLVEDDYRDISPGSSATLIEDYIYFQRLGEYGNNVTNKTCGVIAIQMLYNYYDSFHNDRIIDDSYDVQIRNPFNDIKQFHTSPGSSEEFHQYLINFSLEYDVRVEDNGMTFSEQKEIAIGYLVSRGFQKNADFKWHTSENNAIDQLTGRTKTITKNAINEDRPIIVNVPGHSMVAYGYDSNYVYVNRGYFDKAHNPLWEPNEEVKKGRIAAVNWSFIQTAIDIEFKNDHVHSDNFISALTENVICGDGTIHKLTNITQTDYDFEAQYFFVEKTKTITKGGLTFDTTRLRTGFIEKEYINLSAKRKGAGRAFLSYNFNQPISRINVELALWSGAEQLYFYFDNTSALIEYIDPRTGREEILVNLLTDIELTSNRSKPITYSFSFPVPVTKFKFVTTGPAEGSKNSGRLCIGNMLVFTEA